MRLMALGAFSLPGVSCLLWSGGTPCRIATGRKSTSPTSKHEVRISDFSLRLLVSPRTVCGTGDAPDIAAVVGVSFRHHTLHVQSNCKVVDWKDRQ